VRPQEPGGGRMSSNRSLSTTQAKLWEQQGARQRLHSASAAGGVLTRLVPICAALCRAMAPCSAPSAATSAAAQPSGVSKPANQAPPPPGAALHGAPTPTLCSGSSSAAHARCMRACHGAHGALCAASARNEAEE
jgi:hypothetical protein